jgi:NADP-dependent 3-hydroxy acid dehydrogenase YdfG
VSPLVVAITGASAGIGAATARAFAGRGGRLALLARRRDRLDALAAELRGTECLVHAGDVGDRAEVQRFVDAAIERWGRLDVLVNNAGFGIKARVEDTPPEAWERLLRVNLLGTVWGCQAAVPHMRRQRAGVIVNVSSIVGHRAMPSGGAYAATKAAQISITEALRVELAGSGVRACTVHPIGTDTEFRDVLARESGGPTVGGIGPQQKPEDVAAAIVRAALHPRAEVYPHFASRALVWLNAVAPGLVDRVARRAAERSGRL